LPRPFRALLPLAAAAFAMNATPADAASPPLAWQQVQSLRVLCLVQPETRPDADALRGEICRDVVRLATQRAPLPVSEVGFGDPAVIAPGVVTLLVHASVAPDGDGRLLAFSVRPYRAGGVDTAQLFTAAPRALRLPASGPGGHVLERSLAGALAEILPWLAARQPILSNHPTGGMND
jgi:hypothetical protein